VIACANAPKVAVPHRHQDESHQFGAKLNRGHQLDHRQLAVDLIEQSVDLVGRRPVAVEDHVWVCAAARRNS
jgi:hypothetical protein